MREAKRGLTIISWCVLHTVHVWLRAQCPTAGTRAPWFYAQAKYCRSASCGRPTRPRRGRRSKGRRDGLSTSSRRTHVPSPPCRKRRDYHGRPPQRLHPFPCLSGSGCRNSRARNTRKPTQTVHDVGQAGRRDASDKPRISPEDMECMILEESSLLRKGSVATVTQCVSRTLLHRWFAWISRAAG